MSSLATMNKKILRELPLWQMTLEQFAHCYPDELGSVHYSAVKAALKSGEPVSDEVVKEYPSLWKRHQRKK